MSDDVYLLINDIEYTGWKSLSVKRGMERLCGDFSFVVTNAFGPKNSSSRLGWRLWKQLPGAECVVQIGDNTRRNTVLTGYVDSADPDVNNNGNTLTISGRDKTCDLVDCTNILGKYQMNGVRVKDLLEEMCGPFNIKVKDTVGILEKKITTIMFNVGETVFEALDRIAIEQNVLFATDTYGNLLILNSTNAERADVALKLGGVDGNIENLKGSFDLKNRFSKYIVKSQPTMDVTEGWKAGKETALSAETLGVGVRRYRPLVLQASIQTAEKNATAFGVNAQTLIERVALWNSGIREARSRGFTATVSGWRQKAGGNLWKINQVVTLTAPTLDINAEEWLVGEVSFNKDESGTRTDLGLVVKGSYDPDPLQKVMNKTLKSGGWK